MVTPPRSPVHPRARGEQITEQAANQGAAFAEQQDAHEQLTAQFADLQKKHADLLAQLDLTPQHKHTQRPPATGGAGIVLTDC